MLSLKNVATWYSTCTRSLVGAVTESAPFTAPCPASFEMM